VFTARGFSIALPMAARSVPSSTVSVWKPKAAMRAATFSVKAIFVLPSMEIKSLFATSRTVIAIPPF